MSNVVVWESRLINGHAALVSKGKNVLRFRISYENQAGKDPMWVLRGWDGEWRQLFKDESLDFAKAYAEGFMDGIVAMLEVMEEEDMLTEGASRLNACDLRIVGGAHGKD